MLRCRRIFLLLAGEEGKKQQEAKLRMGSGRSMKPDGEQITVVLGPRASGPAECADPVFILKRESFD